MITFHLPIVPPRTTHQAKQIVRVGGFTKLADKPELREVVSDYMSLLRPYVPERPFGYAVKIDLEFTFPWRKSDSKRIRALGNMPHTSRPDCDNMAKTIIDVMVKLGFMWDDSQIYDIHIRKWWGDKVGINVAIEEVEG